MIIVWILLGLVVLLAVVGVVMYNGLIGLRNKVEEGWRQIDVELKRRHDLIPNLVETVKGYASHERGTLEEVMQARSAAMSGASTPAAAAQAEGQLSQALGRLMAVAEAYPDLKANQNFLALQEELTTTEDHIALAPLLQRPRARPQHQGRVRPLEHRRQHGGRQARRVFETPATEAVAPSVAFGGDSAVGAPAPRPSRRPPSPVPSAARRPSRVARPARCRRPRPPVPPSPTRRPTRPARARPAPDRRVFGASALDVRELLADLAVAQAHDVDAAHVAGRAVRATQEKRQRSTPRSPATKDSSAVKSGLPVSVKSDSHTERTSVAPSWRRPSGAGPVASKTQSSVMSDMIASTSPRPNAATKAVKPAWFGPHMSLPSEAREEVGLRVAAGRHTRSDGPGRSGRPPPCGRTTSPRRPRAPDRARVLPDRRGEVPAVHEVVGHELADVSSIDSSP